MSAGVRYRVVKRLAQGGMAEIFLALQSGAQGFQKPVVLKRILPGLASDPSFVRMLVDEAHIASTLNHSNLVQVLDFRHSGSEYFLVLEFVDGWSLEQLRRRAAKAKVKLPLPHILYIASSLCRALAYVHTRKRDGEPLGIIHRDVTPQNVLLSCEGEVKLADFGIAKAAGKREKSITGVIKGKFAYMSPEQATGLELDARSDLFSVGTLLYVLTTGKKPFDGPTDLDVILQVRKARFDKPSSFLRDYNLDVERLIGRALRANIERRWQTAEQMADKIDAIRSDLGQPSGPAALKRWLEALSERDGVKAAADASVEDSGGSDVVPLTSQDLDLEEIAPLGDPRNDLPTRAGTSPALAAEMPTIRRPSIHSTPTRVAPNQTARLAELTRSGLSPVEIAGPDEGARFLSVAASETEALGFFARTRRAVRRLVVRTLVLAVAGGVGLYFARPYMPAWMAAPVNDWLHKLPLPLEEPSAK